MSVFLDWNVIMIDNNHGGNWIDRMSIVASDASVEEILKNEKLFTNGIPKRSFGIFKRGFLPAHEDTRNTGRFILSCPPESLKATLVKFTKSKLFTHENVSGIYINKKKELGVWTTTRTRAILDDIQQLLKEIAPTTKHNFSWEDFKDQQSPKVVDPTPTIRPILKKSSSGHLDSLNKDLISYQLVFNGWDLFTTKESKGSWQESISVNEANPTLKKAIDSFRVPNYWKAIFRQGRVPIWEEESNFGRFRKDFKKFEDIEKFLTAFPTSELNDDNYINGIYLSSRQVLDIWLGNCEEKDKARISNNIEKLVGKGWAWESFVEKRKKSALISEFLSTGILKKDGSVESKGTTLKKLFKDKSKDGSVAIYRNQFPEMEEKCFILETKFSTTESEWTSYIYEIFKSLKSHGVPEFKEIIDGVVTRYDEGDSTTIFCMFTYPYRLNISKFEEAQEITINLAQKVKQLIISKLPGTKSLQITCYPHEHENNKVTI